MPLAGLFTHTGYIHRPTHIQLPILGELYFHFFIFYKRWAGAGGEGGGLFEVAAGGLSLHLA